MFKYQLVLNVAVLCHTLHRGNFMLCYLQRNGIHSLTRSQRNFNCGTRQFGLNPDFIL